MADAAVQAKAPKAVIPPNPLCWSGDVSGTLEHAHTMMELINALDCNEGRSEFEMPASGSSALATLRKMVEDSIRYAADLSQED